MVDLTTPTPEFKYQSIGFAAEVRERRSPINRTFKFHGESMRYPIRWLQLVVVGATLMLASVAGRAQTSAFNFQGRLTDSGSPANGSYDLQLTLWDAQTGGSQIPVGAPITLARDDVNVTNGIFTVQLDFGGLAFPGPERFLEIGVRPGASTGSFTTLTPRQQLTSTPYAIRSSSAANVTGVVGIANGGTGSSSQNFVDLSNSQTIDGAKTFTSTIAGNINGAAANNVLKSGDTMTGQLNMSNNRITSLGPPANGSDAATKAYVDSAAFGGSGAFPWEVVSGTSQQAQSNRGYIANDASLVTVTLPTAPNVGDVVRISGAGDGGWKIAQNTGQSIRGIRLAGFGEIWNRHGGNNGWRAAASSADGSKLVAVSYSPDIGIGQIYTSTDFGVTWTQRDESNRRWFSVASSADGSKLVAGTTSGQIYTSTDSGVSWTPRENSRQWVAVASSADGNKLVAVDFQGQIYTSTDSGMTWTPRDSNRGWKSVASSADGSKLAAVAETERIYTSTDSGVSWTPQGNTRSWRAIASSADGSKLVAVVNNGQIYTSSDSGFSWIPRESNRFWTGVASSADGSKLVATVLGGLIYASTDSGHTWTPRENERPWQAVASSADASILIALETGDPTLDDGSLYISRANTTPGTVGYLQGAKWSAVELQYIGNGLWVPLSHEGTLIAF